MYFLYYFFIILKNMETGWWENISELKIFLTIQVINVRWYWLRILNHGVISVWQKYIDKVNGKPLDSWRCNSTTTVEIRSIENMLLFPEIKEPSMLQTAQIPLIPDTSPLKYLNTLILSLNCSLCDYFSWKLCISIRFCVGETIRKHQLDIWL